MRIIAGKHRGRVLAAFQGEAVRPTSDRVKESLFQILMPRIPGARVVDLFCGSGALGLESLSRGARYVIFNDSSRESLSLCKKNAAALKEEGEFHCLDYEACLKTLSGKYDIIFSDPPYRADYTEIILRLVAARDLLAEGGLVVAESEREETAPAGWERVDFRSYGRTKVAMFQRSKL